MQPPKKTLLKILDAHFPMNLEPYVMPLPSPLDNIVRFGPLDLTVLSLGPLL